MSPRFNIHINLELFIRGFLASLLFMWWRKTGVLICFVLYKNHWVPPLIKPFKIFFQKLIFYSCVPPLIWYNNFFLRNLYGARVCSQMRFLTLLKSDCSREPFEKCQDDTNRENEGRKEGPSEKDSHPRADAAAEKILAQRFQSLILRLTLTIISY